MAQVNASFFKDVVALLKRHEAVVSALRFLAGFVLGACSALIPLYVAMTSFANDTLDKRMRSYERLMGGLSFNQAEDHDEAISSFRAAIVAKDASPLSEDTMRLASDGLLFALCNCDNPEKHSEQFAKLEGQLRMSAPEAPLASPSFWLVLIAYRESGRCVGAFSTITSAL